MDDEELVKVNRDFLLTETTVDPTIPVGTVLEWLRARKTTGQLVVDLSQGGTQRVALLEKTKAPEGVREKIRKLIGV